jgi:hypothetical protein
MRVVPLIYLLAIVVLAFWPDPSWKYPLVVPAIGVGVWLFALYRLRAHGDDMGALLAGLVATAALAGLTLASWLHLGMLATLLLVALVVMVQPVVFVVVLSQIGPRND